MENLRLENMQVIFKNFGGQKGPYNAEGIRTFSVVINDLEYAEQLLDLGWALKPLKNEDEEIDAYHLPVKINYASRQPPRIYKVSMINNASLLLDDRNVEMLDLLPIEYADLIVSPYKWEVRGETGIKAYLQTMYVVIEENELDIKWANVRAMQPEPDYPEEPPF